MKRRTTGLRWLNNQTIKIKPTNWWVLWCRVGNIKKLIILIEYRSTTLSWEKRYICNNSWNKWVCLCSFAIANSLLFNFYYFPRKSVYFPCTQNRCKNPLSNVWFRFCNFFWNTWSGGNIESSHIIERHPRWNENETKSRSCIYIPIIRNNMCAC